MNISQSVINLDNYGINNLITANNEVGKGGEIVNGSGTETIQNEIEVLEELNGHYASEKNFSIFHFHQTNGDSTLNETVLDALFAVPLSAKQH